MSNPDPQLLKQLYARAIRSLSLRDYTVAQIRAKLQEKTDSVAAIEQTISKLLADNFLNDDRFADNFIRSQLFQKPQGPTLLSAKLRAKGISPELIQTKLSHLRSDKDSLIELARAALQSRRSLFRLPPDVFRRRAAGFLSRRGFPASVIFPLIDDWSVKR